MLDQWRLEAQWGELVGGGDTLQHYHLADRATNAGLQSALRIRTAAITGTVLAEDDVVIADTSSGAITLTLPPARNGKEYELVLSGTNTLTITPAAGDTFMGDVNAVVSVNKTALHIKATTQNWIVI